MATVECVGAGTSALVGRAADEVGAAARVVGAATVVVGAAALVVGAAALVITAGCLVVSEVTTDLVAASGDALAAEAVARLVRATGMNAGRAVSLGIAGIRRSASPLDWGRVIPMTTTAQPATAREAVTADTIRPTYMWPVCQVLLE